MKPMSMLVSIVLLSPFCVVAQSTNDPVDTRIGEHVVPLSRLKDIPETPGTLSVMTPIRIEGTILVEPSIAASRTNPALVVVGFNDYAGPTMHLFTSTSGGVDFPITFDLSNLPGMIYPFLSDPVVRADASSTFYFAGVGYSDDCTNLTKNAIFMTKSSDGGQTWVPMMTVDRTLDGGNVFHDKPWLAVDRWVGTPDVGRLWVNWNKYPIPCSPYGVPQIQTSSDGGALWTAPVPIFQPQVDDTAIWPGGAVALRDGTALAAYVGEPVPGVDFVRVVKCTQNSCSLMTSLFVDPVLDNEFRFPNLPGTRTNSIPIMAINDLPNGNGDVLLVWMDIRTGLGQIRAAVSKNNGRSFRTDDLVDPTATTDQFQPSAGWWVDANGQSNAVVCYYRRVSETTQVINYICARSTDDGRSWATTVLTDVPFVVGQTAISGFLGDYTDYDGEIRETAYTVSDLIAGPRLDNYIAVQSFQ